MTFTGALVGLSTRASRLLQSHLWSLGVREDRGVFRRKALVERIWLRVNSAIVGATAGPSQDLAVEIIRWWDTNNWPLAVELW